MAAQAHADTVHGLGGKTRAPGSLPPSIQLEGERNRSMSLYFKADHIKMNGDHAEEDHNNQRLPKDPVGTPDGDKYHPNRPIQPPDDKKGAQGVDGVEAVEREIRPKEAKDKLGGKVEDDGGH
ncbi:hypothetical protein BDN67DRAFT_980768 [Paxillus ammoniavirescens]|nr:hypothetical protein BDN67DRAFT_980768 [Paxillus ammoniavirescens]